jgi:hypothetical protein
MDAAAQQQFTEFIAVLDSFPSSTSADTIVEAAKMLGGRIIAHTRDGVGRKFALDYILDGIADAMVVALP